MSQPEIDAFSPYGEHLSVQKTAIALGVSQKRVYDLLHAGEIPSYRIGSRWLILRDEVRAYLEFREI